jgi:hypothetical protein
MPEATLEEIMVEKFPEVKKMTLDLKYIVLSQVWWYMSIIPAHGG